jgi:hypothetical protein
MSADYGLNLTSFPGVYAVPLSSSELVTNVFFVPLARRLGTVPGIVADNVLFGGFKVAWDVSSRFVLQCIVNGTDYNLRNMISLSMLRRY